MPSPREPSLTGVDPAPLGSLAGERLATLTTVATDVDGTLTRAGELGPELVRALFELRAAGIRVIPTLVFIDRSGTAQGFTGVMPADQLKAVLINISSGDAQ